MRLCAALLVARSPPAWSLGGGRVVLRSHGVYAAMRLSRSEDLWSPSAVGRCHRGDKGYGIWSGCRSRWRRRQFISSDAGYVVASLGAVRRARSAPFGSLCARRESEAAEAIRYDAQRTRWLASGGGFLTVGRRAAAFHKGSCSDDAVDSGIGRRAGDGVTRRSADTLGADCRRAGVPRARDRADTCDRSLAPDFGRCDRDAGGVVSGRHRRLSAASSAMSLLVVDRLRRSFGGVRAVDSVSFTLDGITLRR